MITISEEIKQVFNNISDKGFEVYIVGGFVRDSILKIKTYDVDMTTNAKPEQLKEIFKSYSINEKYMKYGCIKFSVNKFNFEITTFRREKSYINHRTPEIIEYLNDLNGDLKRRDFTINSICFDLISIIDKCDGIEDLNNKIIKTIGDADYKIEEDVLRILRALRFSSSLGFDIECNLNEAIKKHYKHLKNISFFTLKKELIGILSGKNYKDVLKKYKDIFIDAYDLNDLKVEMFKENMSLEEKEALFFYYSEVNIKNKYLKNKNLYFCNDKKNLKNIIKKHGYDSVFDVLYFKSKYLSENIEVFDLLKEIKSNNECFNLEMLAIKAKDLIEIGIKKDKINKYLNMLLDKVINEECSNNKNELIKQLRDNSIE